jgi:hypothetical protein
MSDTARRYPVRPKTSTMVLGGLFFLFCALVLFWQALTNKRGLVLEGLLHLSPGGARVFYGVLCGLSLAFVAISIVVLVIYSGRTAEVVLDDASITTPGPLWRPSALRTVAFADVVELREQKVSGQHFLTLITAKQKVSIVKGHLPDGAFEEISAFVRERVRR